MFPTWEPSIVGLRLADDDPAWSATMTNWPARCSGESAAYAVSTQEAADGVTDGEGDDDAVGSAVTEAPGVLGEGAEVHAVSAAKAASPIPKARQGVEVTARPYDAGVARTKSLRPQGAGSALGPEGGPSGDGRRRTGGWLLTRSRPRRVPGRRW
ncbi:hypothetical protein BN10_780014 [Phycicoccus elongatus Lp2]|uniref:Uncharacterized protein n=1 Tax=Phycicoccus elongatus Lp2 TaxID=1193181 RepID=N0E2H4_9MICO|nr:hypothetical protein BN10_780014 [Phycicoccus elongatus Lp2]